MESIDKEWQKTMSAMELKNAENLQRGKNIKSVVKLTQNAERSGVVLNYSEK